VTEKKLSARIYFKCAHCGEVFSFEHADRFEDRPATIAEKTAFILSGNLRKLICESCKGTDDYFARTITRAVDEEKRLSILTNVSNRKRR
jgi:RNase P subunit RPR2